MNRLSTEKRARVIGAFVEGNSINPTCRMSGIGKHSVLRQLEDGGEICAAFHERHARNIHTRRLQCDESWPFVGCEMKNATHEQVSAGWGDVWTWTAIDADTRLSVP